MENRKDKDAFIRAYERAVMKGAIESTRPFLECDILDKSEYKDKRYLLLKSLENISDEDYNELMNVLETHMPEHFINAIINNESFSINIFKSFRALDYLRSRGYLLPFRKYTIDQILEMGWANYE